MNAHSRSEIRSVLDALKGILWVAVAVFILALAVQAGTYVANVFTPQDTAAKVGKAPVATATVMPVAPTPTSMPLPTLTPLPTATPAPPTPIPPTPTLIPEPHLVARVNGANVRLGPSTAYERIGYLPEGAEAPITGWSGAWWQIVYEDTTAFVFGDLVTAYGVDGLPEVAAPPLPEVTPEIQVTPIPDPAPVWAIDEARWIDVNLSTQTLTAYEGQTPVKAYLVSTGLPQTPTPTGQYRIWIKFRTDDMAGTDYYIKDVPWVMYFYGGYGLHGVTWHGNFGHPMSHGCINEPNDMAAWLFAFADVGTLVNIHE